MGNIIITLTTICGSKCKLCNRTPQLSHYIHSTVLLICGIGTFWVPQALRPVMTKISATSIVTPLPNTFKKTICEKKQIFRKMKKSCPQCIFITIIAFIVVEIIHY